MIRNGAIAILILASVCMSELWVRFMTGPEHVAWSAAMLTYLASLTVLAAMYIKRSCTSWRYAGRQPSRIRRTLKWWGFALCALIAGAWLVSVGWAIEFSTGNVWASLEHGVIRTGYSSVDSAHYHAYAFATYEKMRWSFWWFNGGSFWTFVLPLWVPFLVLAPPTCLFWWRDLTTGYCKCGYNLTGNVSGVCPECGTEIKRP